ncbi:MAG: response regulator [bacterium]|nr:response regulator [bacterium]
MPKQKKKILIVEDDKFTYKLYTGILSDAGYEVVSTTMASEAVRMVEEHLPDLIIMDLMLQDGNGFDAITEIRKLDCCKTTPIIALSNLGQDADIAEATKRGATKYYVKSNTKFQKIVETIDELLG